MTERHNRAVSSDSEIKRTLRSKYQRGSERLHFHLDCEAAVKKNRRETWPLNILMKVKANESKREELQHQVTRWRLNTQPRSQEVAVTQADFQYLYNPRWEQFQCEKHNKLHKI